MDFKGVFEKMHDIESFGMYLELSFLYFGKVYVLLDGSEHRLSRVHADVYVVLELICLLSHSEAYDLEH